ncbi:MAG: hypothetical protein QOG04_1471 [Actinomycetota bacterium]|jgi:two-component system response regulator DevR|nr:hypothetical protein [Actinomycetota bacterium]
MPTKPTLKVFLVDDHEIVLHGLSEYIDSAEGISVVGMVTSGEEALRVIGSAHPDVAVLDVRLPDMDGITLCREIRAAYPGTHCLMLSSYASEDARLEAIIAGASGYVLKEARLSEVVDSIRSVGAGKALLDPLLTQKVLDRIREVPNGGKGSLTAQEQRVLDLMALGETNREISKKLYLAEQTVKNYVSGILAKLGMQRRTQAAVYATNLKRNEQEVERFPK